MNKLFVWSLPICSLAVLLLALTACSEGKFLDRHDQTDNRKIQRCLMNYDCPQGERCVEGFCEDIFHPRKDIKNY